MKQLVYTMFISNNCTSFHLWGKENLVKHQKVSKYYENYCGSNLTTGDSRTGDHILYYQLRLGKHT